MNYTIVETYYGPDIRRHDWESQGLNAVHAGGVLQLFAEDVGHAANRFYRANGGGNVAMSLTFLPLRVTDDSRLEIRFNDRFERDKPLWEPRDPAFRFVMTTAAAEVHYRQDCVARRHLASDEIARAHTVTLATLADAYCLTFDGQLLAEGVMRRPINDNEGMLAMSLADMDIEVLSCQEDFIGHDVEIPEWKRTGLLYEETFGPESFEANWLCNGQPPDFTEGAFIFRRESNSVLRPRFAEPIAVDFVATPVPRDCSARVTDMISLWMVDHPDGDLLEYLAGRDDAKMHQLFPLSLYWVDMGGSNNVNTRLRKNPNRQLVRQFTDRAHLMERDRSYAITLVQNGHFIEYWVDGEAWIRFFDPEAILAGHVGFRAFCSDLEVAELKVWSIE